MENQNFFPKKVCFNSIILLFITALLQFSHVVRAQDLIWAKRAGGFSFDSGAGIAVDTAGNSYVTGSFQGAAIFGAGEANEIILNSVDFLDIFVAKYDVNGSLLWAKQAGDSAGESGNHIAVDAFGNSYITGLFEETATFGANEASETTLTSVGSRDIFVAKYSTDGLLLWAKQAGGSNSNDHAEGIAVDASGNSYITGFFNDSATFGAGETNETTLNSSGSFDIYIAKYDASGLLQWAKEAGSSSFDIGAGIAVDVSDNVYITGFFEGAATFGTGEANQTILTSADARDIFVAKYNAAGLLLWAKRAGGSGSDEGFGIVVDVSGNNYITGRFEGTATFGASEANEVILDSEGSNDIFVAKFDANGLILQAKQAGGSGNDAGYGVVVDASGNSYITGQFEGSATFGAGESNEATLISIGANDIFAARYDADGLLLWAKQAGGNSGSGGSGDFGFGIGLDAFGNSYVTGQFERTSTFGAGEINETALTSAGGSDIFVARYGAGSPTHIEDTSIPIGDFKLAQNYPNPFNPVTNIGFAISDFGFVELKVFDTAGRLVKTLVSENRDAGLYSVQWDATDDVGVKVASGIYFYKLNAGEFTATKKMILFQ